MIYKQPDPKCEDCGGTGWVHLDEYEKGQIVGVATDSQRCKCVIVHADGENEQDEY